MFQGITDALGSGVGAIIDGLKKTFQSSRAAGGAFERTASEERQKEREDLELDRRIEDVRRALNDVESACNRAVDESAARVVAAIGMDPGAASKPPPVPRPEAATIKGPFCCQLTSHSTLCSHRQQQQQRRQETPSECARQSPLPHVNPG